jgi:hypothetical protein
MASAQPGPDIVADVTLMRTGAVQLARLADELASMAAHAAALPVLEPSLAARRDRLVASLGHRVITLAVLADRVRRDADALTAAERQADLAFRGIGQVLDAVTDRAGGADGQ